MAGQGQRRSQSSRDAEKIDEAVAEFGTELGPRMRGDGRPEDRLRAPIYKLLKNIGAILGRDVVVHDEVPLSDISARPDFAVDTAGGRVGYIELKAFEKGIPGNWHPTKHDREQLDKLSRLPNLIYTNGSQWGLYRKGVLVGQIATMNGDIRYAGRRLQPTDQRFEQIFREFLVWKPDQPRTLRAVVSDVAPLCRLLREQVAETLDHEAHSPGRKPFTRLANEWRDILFPTLDNREFINDFVDAYAQTVTFAMLLARVDGITFEGRSINEIAEQLSKQHSLIGESLSLLANSRWAKQISVVETLRRVIGNIDWNQMHAEQSDAYSLLYETFLSEYDSELRRRSGTYYTPDSVARAMVNFTDLILKTRMNKKRGFASDNVITVDPAMGTGTFLVEIIDSVVTTLQSERHSSSIPKAHLRELFAKRLVGFELQAAPYAVAELRLHHILKTRYGVELPREEVRYLTNTLDDPDKLPFDFGQLYEVLKDAREGANRIKRNTPVLVVIGNPPWREQAKGSAPWIEERRNLLGRLPDLQSRPSLDEYRLPGQGRREFKLSNMWTYFWRWSTWKVFDAHPEEPAGIVVLITPSAYITSQSHAGMRKYLRETADEGWVIDVTPEGFQPDVPTRLFPNVQQPICIGIFARYGKGDKNYPASIHHTAISGTQSSKFEKLLNLKPNDSAWNAVPSEWTAPFQPASLGWESYPGLSDLLPWKQPGVKPNRNWVYAPDRETLLERWATLIYADRNHKSQLFKETTDRSVERQATTIPGLPIAVRPVGEEKVADVDTVAVAFRSFDRQYLIYDARVIDRPRPELWQVRGDRQVYVTEPPAYVYTRGPALVFSSLIPDMHYFMGHHGGQVRPLYRDQTGQEANVPPRLLACLSSFVGAQIDAENLLAYIAGIVAHPGFTNRFHNELTKPGIRVPLTMDRELWQDVVAVGAEVLWLHTYGERYVDEASGRPHACPTMPEGRQPIYEHQIPASDFRMPDKIEYDPSTETLTIGEEDLLDGAGRIRRVSPAVRWYTVGDTHVLDKWFDYRRRKPRQKRYTSELDKVNPTRWTAQFDDDLMALLNVLGRLVALEPAQNCLLEQVCNGPLITVNDLEREEVLPVPETCRKPPKIVDNVIF